ncbi:AGC/AGC-unique protein kinase [Coprinopsis sp. MPI-PUGE-AT-0042]|nr:AGC/AGC-unique protein kinase [Coprinopsis sp. MPI-PUGE-AT-0042]
MSITASFCEFSDSGESTETSTGTILRDLDLSPRQSQLVSTPLSFTSSESNSNHDPPVASFLSDGIGHPSAAVRVASRLSSPVPPRLDVEWPNSPPLTLSLKMSGVFDHVDLSLPVDGDLTLETHRSESPGFDMTYDVQAFPNLQDVSMELGDDSEISEVVAISQKLSSSLSTIPEANEPSPVLAYTTSLSDFEILATVQAGDTETKVLLCERKKSGRIYKIRSRRICDNLPWPEQDILELLRDLGAPFLPHLKSVFREGNRVYLVLDDPPSMTLSNLVAKYRTLSPQRVLFYASEILSGIASLHTTGIMHRNLNPDDVLLDRQGHVMLSNFEFARFVGAGLTLQADLSLPKFSPYHAPEVVLGWAHDEAVDCWGFGMLVYFMLIGKHPAQGDVSPFDHRAMRSWIVQGSFSPEFLRPVPVQARDIITKCVERNPRARLPLERIKSHPYFTNVPWNKVADKMVEVPSIPGHFERDSENIQSPYFTQGPSSGSAMCLGGRTHLSPRPFNLSPSVSFRGDSCVSESLHGHLSLHSPKARTLRPHAELTATPGCAKSEGATSAMEIWDIIDREVDRGSIASTADFGRSVVSFFRAKRLRKNSSSANLFGPFTLNLSTASLGQKMRRGKSSLRALRNGDPVALGDREGDPIGSAVELPVLPTGTGPMGSGIGFQYRARPDASASKTSVGTTAPRTCRPRLCGGKVKLAIPRGLKLGWKKSRAKPINADASTSAVASPATTGLSATAPLASPLPQSSSVIWVGTADIFQAVEQPSSPSPSALSSPVTDEGPFTPTTVCNNDTEPQPQSLSGGSKENDLEVSIDDGVKGLEDEPALRLVTPMGIRLV